MPTGVDNQYVTNPYGTKLTTLITTSTTFTTAKMQREDDVILLAKRVFIVLETVLGLKLLHYLIHW